MSALRRIRSSARVRVPIAVAIGPNSTTLKPVRRSLSSKASAGRVERDHGLDPSWTVEIWPLIGETQMRLDDPAADRLDVQHAGVAGQATHDPRPAIAFEQRIAGGLDDPVVESAPLGRDAGRVARPTARPSWTAKSLLTCSPLSSSIQKCPGLKYRRYSAGEPIRRLPAPIPRRLTIGLENIGNRSGITPAARPGCLAIGRPPADHRSSVAPDTIAMRRHPRSARARRPDTRIRKILQPPWIGLVDRHASPLLSRPAAPSTALRSLWPITNTGKVGWVPLVRPMAGPRKAGNTMNPSADQAGTQHDECRDPLAGAPAPPPAD